MVWMVTACETNGATYLRGYGCGISCAFTHCFQPLMILDNRDDGISVVSSGNTRSVGTRLRVVEGLDLTVLGKQPLVTIASNQLIDGKINGASSL